MKTRFLLPVIAALLGGNVLAAEIDTARSAAEARFAEDKKLCAEEPTSSARMQCLRDANVEYQKSVSGLKPSTKGRSTSTACMECGKVTSVKVEEREGEGGALGTIAGGVAGALVGNQVGQGTGRDLATIAGAVGGAYAGHKIEGKVRTAKVWVVAVHFESGESKTFHFDHDPGFATGTRVRESGATIVRR